MNDFIWNSCIEINDLKQENERLERELKKACKRLSDK